MNDDIDKYIIRQKEKGVSRDSIKNALLDAGHKESDILASLQRAFPVSAGKKPTKLLILFMSLILLGGIYFISKTYFPDMFVGMGEAPTMESCQVDLSYLDGKEVDDALTIIYMQDYYFYKKGIDGFSDLCGTLNNKSYCKKIIADIIDYKIKAKEDVENDLLFELLKYIREGEGLSLESLKTLIVNVLSESPDNFKRDVSESQSMNELEILVSSFIDGLSKEQKSSIVEKMFSSQSAATYKECEVKHGEEDVPKCKNRIDFFNVKEESDCDALSDYSKTLLCHKVFSNDKFEGILQAEFCTRVLA